MDSRYTLHWLQGITIQQLSCTSESEPPPSLPHPPPPRHPPPPNCVVVPDDWISVSAPEDEQQQ